MVLKIGSKGNIFFLSGQSFCVFCLEKNFSGIRSETKTTAKTEQQGAESAAAVDEQLIDDFFRGRREGGFVGECPGGAVEANVVFVLFQIVIIHNSIYKCLIDANI